jgi:methylthioribose-1-phosphate isomerase
MAVATEPAVALRWDGRTLSVLDQTRLPAREAWLTLTGAEDTAAAIRRLAVRGAPLIGMVAAYGLALEVTREPGLGALERGAEVLAGARPTAVNLAWAVERVRAAALAAGPVTMPRRTRQAPRSPVTAPTFSRARGASSRSATPERSRRAAPGPRWR